MSLKLQERVMAKPSETIPFSGEDNSDEDQLARTGIRIPHLKLMVSLDDYGQISAAASVLNMSQPAASRMLSDMETILEAPLYERLPRGIALTPYGKAFARRSRTILLELREASREISDLKNGTGGSVFLGAVTAPAVQIVIPAIRQVRERFPRVSRSTCRWRPATFWPRISWRRATISSSPGYPMI
jgi:DNA-binding transcriptional LysR family regulator